MGATDHTANLIIEPFSSRGPTPDGRVKPDIVGVDAVHSTVYQGLFKGTSQAAPHVAGLAALVIQRFRDSELSDTLAEVAQYLINNAAPRPGVPNHIWGQGLAWLPGPGAPVVSQAPAAAPVVSQAACPPNGSSPDLACDKENLLAAKAELTGTATGALSTWQQGTDIADFEGVTIAGAPPRVTKVDLRGDFLAGQIPARLGNLANLERLNLTHTQMTGPIPPALGNLANLEILELYENQLTGSIPPALGNLANLEKLKLGNNQLTRIPPALGDLANLWHLDLAGNQFTVIPLELGSLPNLTSLFLSPNQLWSIPPNLPKTTNILFHTWDGTIHLLCIPNEHPICPHPDCCA